MVFAQRVATLLRELEWSVYEDLPHNDGPRCPSCNRHKWEGHFGGDCALAASLREAENILACTCPECGGSTRSALEDPSRKPYQPGCATCGGLGLNRHVEIGQ